MTYQIIINQELIDSNTSNILNHQISNTNNTNNTFTKYNDISDISSINKDQDNDDNKVLNKGLNGQDVNDLVKVS